MKTSLLAASATLLAGIASLPAQAAGPLLANGPYAELLTGYDRTHYHDSDNGSLVISASSPTVGLRLGYDKPVWGGLFLGTALQIDDSFGKGSRTVVTCTAAVCGTELSQKISYNGGLGGSLVLRAGFSGERWLVAAEASIDAAKNNVKFTPETAGVPMGLDTQSSAEFGPGFGLDARYGRLDLNVHMSTRQINGGHNQYGPYGSDWGSSAVGVGFYLGYAIEI